MQEEMQKNYNNNKKKGFSIQAAKQIFIMKVCAEEKGKEKSNTTSKWEVLESERQG